MPVDQAAVLLTDIGLEVESVYTYESVKGGLEGLITGEVITCEKHPDADKLKITEVNTGSGELWKIVCGAPNVAAGQKVVVALPGTTVYPVKGEPFTIKKAKIRGAESNGMLCAEDEIGLGESHAGLLVLPNDTPVGIPVKDLFDIYSDSIIEIGLTANHADANSHLGTARELRAALISRGIVNMDLEDPSRVIKLSDNAPGIEVIVEDQDACWRYSGVLMRNVRIAPSPAWLQHKLRAVGMRPINNVVDITNYILHAFGQPLHAFDADKIQGNKIVVKTLPEGTKFITLDEKERTLHARDLMICDAKQGMCIAGVYGGIHSGISDSTSNIFIESACFNPAFIRHTESVHGLKTDASARFAKGTDPEITVKALLKAVELMKELCGGESDGGIIDLYPVPVPPASIFLRFARLKMISAIELSTEKIITILESLNITITEKKEDGLMLSVPSYKNDVLREIDIIEEILRLHGFNNIPVPKSIRTPYLVSPKPDRERIKLDMIAHLVSNGYYEIFTNAISRSKYAKKYLPQTAGHVVELMNSLNAELDSMRPVMLFTGLEVIAHNYNHKQLNLKLFEAGRVYGKYGNTFTEKEKLAVYITGDKYEESWRNKNRKTDWFDIKEITGGLFNKMNSKFEFKQPSEGDAWADLFDAYSEIVSGKRISGIAGEVSREVLESFGIKQKVYYAELDWEVMVENFAARKVTFKEIARYPEMRRDLALVIDASVSFAAVENIARVTGQPILKDLLLFDVYEGEKLGGKKSYAIGLTFGTDDRTLTDTEVDSIMQQLMQRYETELQATIRK